MLTNNTVRRTAVILFFAAEAALGLALQLSHGRAAVYFSYAAVCLACLFCAVFAAREKIYVTTQLALLFTVGADFFLVLSPVQKRLPAMLFFLGVQSCYALRLFLSEAQATRRRAHVAAYAALPTAAVVATLLVLGKGADAVAIISMIYYATLINNIVFAFLRTGFSFFSVGLVLFLLCDTVVGLSILGEYLPIPDGSPLYAVLYPGFQLAWAFYVPSQALLAASAGEKK